MIMMQAVLDTNFWLATHVVVVTLGYASTFFAGALAMAYVILGVFTRSLTTPMNALAAKKNEADTKTSKGVAVANRVELGGALAKMVYAIVCFATLFSFTGTVLGGI